MKKTITAILASIITMIIMIIGIGIYAKIINLNTATEKEIFTVADVKETNFEEQEILSKTKDNILNETDFIYSFEYPTLRLEGENYKVVQQTEQVNYNLETYNRCRNDGKTKAECVQEAKNRIKNQVEEYKYWAEENAREIKRQAEMIDYRSEITLADLMITDLDINPIIKEIEIIK